MRKIVWGACMVAIFLITTEILAQDQIDNKPVINESEVVEKKLDEISVTATRIERKTAEVPASIAVVGQDTLEDSKMHNIKDALTEISGVQVDSKNGGYDSRLVIRGAGLKANYGVREIMVLLNGVPITDPDSFTRFDLIDSQLIERVEVVKGPNSTLWGINAAGGVINIITKKPTSKPEGKIQFGTGNFNTKKANLYYSTPFNSSLLYSVSATHRSSDNSWRRWNKFSTNQYAFQPIIVFDDGTVIENYLSYSEANLQLPGKLDEEMYEDYLNSGEAKETSGLWQYSGRYSKNLFFSSKTVVDVGRFEFKPVFFANKWEHHHPVYAKISNSDSMMGGLDLQFVREHSYGALTFGATTRIDSQKSAYYKYGDIETQTVTPSFGSPYEQIVGVNSDEQGEKMEDQERKTQLSGVYLQESLKPNENWVIDMGIRYDQVNFSFEGDIYSYYDSSKSAYSNCADSDTECDDIEVENNHFEIAKSYQAVSPRVGISYAVNENTHIFGNIGNGIQTPTEGEISENPDLKLVTVTNYEAGIKFRHKNWMMDTTAYQTFVANEVIKVLQEDGTTTFNNAGKTDKKGFELNGVYYFDRPWSVGGSYSHIDYKYADYWEQIRSGSSVTEVDRSGNYLPYSPADRYTLFLRYKKENGFKFKLMTSSWGPYYVDSENTETYEGYDFLLNAMAGYTRKNLDITLNVDNLTDKRYAVEVSKSYGNKYYSPAAPRTIMLAARYKF